MRRQPATPPDPDARAVVDRVNALNAPAFETMPPAAARAIAAQLLRNTPIPPVRVGSVRDFDLPAEGAPMTVRHYRPFGPVPKGGAPTLVYLHGGGWTLGDLDTNDHLCRSLVRQAGVDVISLDYPLSPETRRPETVAACAAALRSVFGQAEALGLNPGRIALGGDSAGGNLTAALCLMAQDGDLPMPKAQVLIYPALDLRPRDDVGDPPPETLFLRRETVDWFVGNYLGGTSAEDWRASPLLAGDLSRLPPSFILTAGYDILWDEGQAFAARLKAAGVTTVQSDFPGQIHNFVAMPHVIPTAYAALAGIAEFLVEHLRGEAGA